MPRIKNSELQFDSIQEPNQPGIPGSVSLYCENRSLKIKRSGDDTTYTVALINDLDEKIKNTNYYTKTEVDNLIQSEGIATGFVVINSNSLPQRPATGKEYSIHLLPKQGGGYEEWLFVNNVWERVGEDDLSNYATQTQVDQKSSVVFKDWTK